MASWNATTQAAPAAQEKENMPSATPTVYEPSRTGSREEVEGASAQRSRGGVDVAQAKEEFATLRRELSRHSQKQKDVEKQVNE
jgi:hypothetical protein